MKLLTKKLNISSKYPIVMLHEKDAKFLGVVAPDRVELRKGFNKKTAFVDVTSNEKYIKPGHIGLYDEVDFPENTLISVKKGSRPKSLTHIKKKLHSKELTKKEIYDIVDDIYNDRLSEIELSHFLTSVYINGMTMNETINLTKAMIKYGNTLKWNKKYVVDKHSIGGVPGNRVTPIVVSILASLGLIVPKTSSRAITSPAGTADTMEVFCDVSFNLKEIKRIVNKTGACIVWGGALDLAPVDDKLIRIEHPLSLDPEGQLLASVMSKKASAGSKYVVIDIPVGDGSKVESFDEGERLAKKFKRIGKELGMKVVCSISKGEQPIGYGIGPVLEAIDILDVFKGHGPEDLKEKSLELASLILELTGKGTYNDAKHSLESGKAFQKFKEIVEAQNGSVNKNFHKMLGKYTYKVYAKSNGSVLEIDNKAIAKLAKIAGAPFMKGSGVKLYKKEDDIVKKNDLLYIVYTESKDKLKDIKEFVKKEKIINVGHNHGMIVESI